MKNKNKEVTSHNESEISGSQDQLLVISHQKSGSQTHVLTGNAYISYIPHPCTIWKNVCVFIKLWLSHISVLKKIKFYVRVQYVYEPYFIILSKGALFLFWSNLDSFVLHVQLHLDIFQIKKQSWTIIGRQNQLAWLRWMRTFQGCEFKFCSCL